MDSSLPGSSVHGISRQNWSGLPFPSPWDLPYPGIKPASPALEADSLPLSLQGSPCDYNKNQQEKERLLSFPGNNTVNDKSSPLPYKSILLSIIGIVVCVLWLSSIRSYKQLSSVKYDIVNEIEKKLPLAPFTYEWEKLKLEHNYVGLTRIENVLPWLFLVLYAVAIIYPILKLILNLLCPCVGGAV